MLNSFIAADFTRVCTALHVGTRRNVLQDPEMFDGENRAPVVIYPVIYRVSTIQGGAGYLPATVCHDIFPTLQGTETATHLNIRIFKLRTGI